jgi:hypothetical protein
MVSLVIDAICRLEHPYSFAPIANLAGMLFLMKEYKAICITKLGGLII